jgi:hypothetical protein
VTGVVASKTTFNEDFPELILKTNAGFQVKCGFGHSSEEIVRINQLQIGDSVKAIRHLSTYDQQFGLKEKLIILNHSALIK